MKSRIYSLFIKQTTNPSLLLLGFLFVIAIFFRFYNIGWSNPYFFNPDERQNIAYPILESHSPFMVDQKNFDTGTFPLIVIKLLFLFISSRFPHLVPDPTGLIIFISRICSAILSLGISVLLYVLAQQMFSKSKAVLTYILSIFSIGFIQFAHFGTIELWETFFFLLLFYCSSRIQKKITLQDSFLTGIIFGISLATKVLTGVLLPILVGSFFVGMYKNRKKKMLIYSLWSLSVFLVVAAVVFVTVSPQVLTNFQAFYASVHFESTVALGTLPIFYTQEFYKTIPFLFQLVHIYPFLLNPLLMLFLPISVVYCSWIGIKNRNSYLLLIVLFFLVLFGFESYVFVKWTRYVVPTLPFVYLLIAYFLDDLITWTKSDIRIQKFIFLIPVLVSVIFACAFLSLVYATPDTRVIAATWAKNNIPPSAHILSEPYDLGLLPFSGYFSSIDTADFYSLDADKTTQIHLLNQLSTADYILLPSQRIRKTRLLNRSQFPIGNRFYTSLLNGSLGFEKVYETPCNLACNLVYLGNPVFSFEETASVFDRPMIAIFKKTEQVSPTQYQNLLGIR